MRERGRAIELCSAPGRSDDSWLWRRGCSCAGAAGARYAGCGRWRAASQRVERQRARSAGAGQRRAGQGEGEGAVRSVLQGPRVAVQRVGGGAGGLWCNKQARRGAGEEGRKAGTAQGIWGCSSAHEDGGPAAAAMGEEAAGRTRGSNARSPQRNAQQARARTVRGRGRCTGAAIERGRPQLDDAAQARPPPPPPPLCSAAAAIGALCVLWRASLRAPATLALVGPRAWLAGRAETLRGASHLQSDVDTHGCQLPCVLIGLLLPQCAHTRRRPRGRLHGEGGSGARRQAVERSRRPRAATHTPAGLLHARRAHAVVATPRADQSGLGGFDRCQSQTGAMFQVCERAAAPPERPDPGDRHALAEPSRHSTPHPTAAPGACTALDPSPSALHLRAPPARETRSRNSPAP
ncbi:hypothetical protein SVAN01_07799 [Stagonosporopsis vannaccii]|nr:hypothetical protein SVAN01_07799 [Stagonosporopsis vannaccii]